MKKNILLVILAIQIVPLSSAQAGTGSPALPPLGKKESALPHQRQGNNPDATRSRSSSATTSPSAGSSSWWPSFPSLPSLSSLPSLPALFSQRTTTTDATTPIDPEWINIVPIPPTATITSVSPKVTAPVTTPAISPMATTTVTMTSSSPAPTALAGSEPIQPSAPNSLAAILPIAPLPATMQDFSNYIIKGMIELEKILQSSNVIFALDNEKFWEAYQKLVKTRQSQWELPILVGWNADNRYGTDISISVILNSIWLSKILGTNQGRSVTLTTEQEVVANLILETRRILGPQFPAKSLKHNAFTNFILMSIEGKDIIITLEFMNFVEKYNIKFADFEKKIRASKTQEQINSLVTEEEEEETD